MMRFFAPLAALLLMAAAQVPEMADTPLPDPVQERQAQELMAELRCLVCQNQSVADSHAEMAGDMRALVRTRIAAGEKPEDVRAYLISRYGDWVTFRPPLDAQAGFLWFAPLLFVLVGGALAWPLFRKRRK